MQNSPTTTCLVTLCVTLTVVAQFACGGHRDQLNDNEGAQVAQANTNNQNQPLAAQIPNDNRAIAMAPPSTANANVNTAAPPAATAAGPPSREQVEKNKTLYQRAAKERGRTIGHGPNDAWLWVRIMFLLDYSLPGMEINVDVVDGTVTLSGTVTNQQQVKEAESLVRPLEGVKSVRNSLTVARSK